MYGYTAQEMTGQRFGVLIPPERDGEDRAIISRVLAGETVDHFETVRLHKNGKKLDVSVSVSAIRDLSGRIIGASSIARDISESRALVKAQDQVIKRLLLAAEFRDDALGEHIARMSGLCGQLAAALAAHAPTMRPVPAILRVLPRLHLLEHLLQRNWTQHPTRA
jgi:PAS domain S-box-containing protein